jgi:hypothetical protein
MLLALFYLIKLQPQLLILPHPRLVFPLQGQMMGNPHRVVRTPALQRRQHKFNKFFQRKNQKDI